MEEVGVEIHEFTEFIRSCSDHSVFLSKLREVVFSNEKMFSERAADITCKLVEPYLEQFPELKLTVADFFDDFAASLRHD